MHDHIGVIGDPHGSVCLLDVMGSDQDIVDAARISYDRRGQVEDRNLIRYLMRHRHTSPFEMAEMKFELKMPIFVTRQWVRHRTANMNEVSARYTQLPNEMFVPEKWSLQSTDNKQGREEESYPEDMQKAALRTIERFNDRAYAEYESLLRAGLTRELARGVLPLNTYTKFIWKMDLHNLMHFLKLRLDPHAQKEIRMYAEVIERLFASEFPLTYEAFVDYQRDAYTCSRMEMKILRSLLSYYTTHNVDLERVDQDAGVLLSKRELQEFRRRFLDG